MQRNVIYSIYHSKIQFVLNKHSGLPLAQSYISIGAAPQIRCNDRFVTLLLNYATHKSPKLTGCRHNTFIRARNLYSARGGTSVHLG